MACTPITPARFKILKTQFASVDDVVVQGYIDTAQIWAAGGWPESACEAVQVAVTCHLMTIDGLGDDQRSKNFSTGRSDFQSVRSGNVTLTRFRSSAERAGLSTGDWFSQTPCGQQFLVFVRMFSSGPRYAHGGVSVGANTYAKDAYRDGWWTC